MPTARELLEQADALMRRNRGGDAGIPVLTDSVPDAPPPLREAAPRERTGLGARPAAVDRSAPRDLRHREERVPTAEAPPAGDRSPDASRPRTAEQAALKAAARNGDASARLEPGRDAEPPLLTDAVEEVAVDLEPMPPPRVDEDHSLWLGPDTIDPALHSITGPAPDTVAVVPPVTLRAEPRPVSSDRGDERDPTITRTLRAAGSAPTPPPAGSAPPVSAEPAVPEREPVVAPAANEDERWNALAEQISMQVLQRLDLFIDTGLKAQLAAHLHPIVARASAELVGAINDHVGQLVRTYVAEAIEREIAQWRQQNK